MAMGPGGSGYPLPGPGPVHPKQAPDPPRTRTGTRFTAGNGYCGYPERVHGYPPSLFQLFFLLIPNFFFIFYWFLIVYILSRPNTPLSNSMNNHPSNHLALINIRNYLNKLTPTNLNKLYLKPVLVMHILKQHQLRP